MENGKIMKKQFIIEVIIVVLITVGLSGCMQQESSQESVSIDQSQIQANSPTTESIYQILEKSETFESMYYEIDALINMSEFGTQAAMIKIWQKPPYIKEEIISTTNGITTPITLIHRPEGIYLYDTEKGKYILTMDVSMFSTSLQYFDTEQIKNYLNTQTSNDFNTEIIDGKKATVMQFIPLQGENHMTIQMWIWNEKGVPLKANIEMTMEDMIMTMNFNFSNYSFSDIPNSTFNVS
jgi:hypothetical protein